MSETGEHASNTKIRKIQILLARFFHANKCRQNDIENENINTCLLPHCDSMKNLINHLKMCKNRNCNEVNCASLRDSLKHYKQCKNQECPVCAPLKLEMGKKRKVKTEPESNFDDNIPFDDNISIMANSTHNMTEYSLNDITFRGGNQSMVSNNQEIRYNSLDSSEASDPWVKFVNSLNQLSAETKRIDEVCFVF